MIGVLFDSRFARKCRLAAAPGLVLAASLLTACGTVNGPGQHWGQSRQGLMAFSDAAAQSGNPALAVHGYRKILQRDGEDVQVLAALGAVLIDNHEVAEAISVLERAVALRDAAEQSRRHRAQHFRHASTHRRSDHRARDPERLLGRAYLKAHQPRKAEPLFVRVLERDPDSFEASMDLAVALDFQGRHDEAQARYEELLRKRGDDVALRVNYGASLVFSGLPEEAVQVLSPVALMPGAPQQARTNLALAYAVLGDEDMADKAGFNTLTPEERRESLAFLKWAKAEQDHRCHHVLAPRAKGTAVKDSQCRKVIVGDIR